MARKLLSFTLLLVLLVSAAVPMTVHAQASDSPALNTTEFTLENGLDVILVEDHSAPTIAVDVWYHVGGANDPEGRSGFAHLFEHMMFQGSAHLGKLEHPNLVEAAGGSINAYTTAEFTGYWETLPSHQLPLALWLEAERMSSLAVTQENLDNQRAVVIEEYQLRVGNSPYGEAVEDLFTLPYDYAPFQKRVIGSVTDLNAANVEDVRNYHATYYVPNNATLVVAGDIDPEQTRAMIEEYFGPIPAGEEPPALPAYEPTVQTEPVLYTIEDPQIFVPALLTGYVVPPQDHPDYAALDLLNLILSGGNSSRMSKLFIDTGKAAAAYTGLQGNKGPSLFYVVLIANPGTELTDLETEYNAELTRIQNEGVDPAELEKAINQIRSSKLLSLETAFDLAESVQAANFYFGSPDAVFGQIDAYTEVTSEDIQRVITDYLTPEKRHAFTVVPGGEPVADTTPPVVQESTGDEAPTGYILEQSTPPEPLPLNEFTLSDIQSTTLENGLEVIVVSRPEIPIISLDFVLPGGASAVAEDKAGLDDLTTATWTRGTETRSAQDIAGAIEQVGGFMGAGTANDYLTVGALALIEDAPLAFELLGDVVKNPVFPETEIEIARQNLLTGLEFNMSEPSFLASRAFSDLVYGDHPYGNIVTADTVSAVTREDILAYYEAQLNPATAFLVVAGDITFEDGVALAEQTFGDLEAEPVEEAAELPEPAQPDSVQIYLVDRPGSTQADFRIGNIAANASNPDRFSIRVMNEILGGGFSSRLFRNIREDKGFAYTVGSGFGANKDAGTFVMTASTRNDVAADALREMLTEVERLQAENVTEEELNNAKAGIIGSYAIGLETYQDFVEDLVFLKINELPFDLLESYPADIDAVTADTILGAAQNYVHPENLIVVVVGDASILEEPLSEVAPVTILEAR